jgi:formate dehydrogenase subunit gamma
MAQAIQPVERTRRRASAATRLVRFDGVQRAVHWTNALLFAVLILTALPLYFSSLATLVGERVLVENIHVWTGIALPVPLLLSLVGPWGAQLRRDLRRVNRWSRDEIVWLRALGRHAPKVVDKFNPGQKLNAIFTGGAIVVMLGTGALLKWFRFFPVSWRTGATFVHDVFAFAIVVVIAGHILFALTHWDSMRSMIKGWVTETWAARHAPAWLAEEQQAIDQGARARPR